jgi:hypothetical protein
MIRVDQHILDAFAKLSKATISSVMSVCLAVRPHKKKLGYLRTNFHEIRYLLGFLKSGFIKTLKNDG